LTRFLHSFTFPVLLPDNQWNIQLNGQKSLPGNDFIYQGDMGKLGRSETRGRERRTVRAKSRQRHFGGLHVTKKFKNRKSFVWT